MTEPPPPTVNVECHKIFDPQTGLISVSTRWKLSYNESLEGPYDSTATLELVLQSVEEYHIDVYIVDARDDGRLVFVRGLPGVIIPVSSELQKVQLATNQLPGSSLNELATVDETGSNCIGV